MLDLLTQLETGWGLDVVLWFQSWRGPLITLIFRTITFTGEEDFYLLLLPLLYWCVDARLGRRVGTFFLLTNWTNNWFKEWWQRPRPVDISGQVQPAVEQGGFGLPSGHAQNTTTLWGAIALYIRQQWLTILIVVYVLLVGLSRLVLGVHYPQDVLVGWLIGVAWLGVYAWAEPRTSRWLSRLSVWAQIGLVLLVTALALVIHPGLFPPASEDGLSGAVTPIAAFMGAAIGYALELRFLGFSAGGVWWKRVLRFLLGAVVALGLRFGLGAAFEGLEPALIFRLIRYGLIGLWVGYGAPWVFVKVRLADKE